MQRFAVMAGLAAMLVGGRANADYITGISAGAGFPAAATLTSSSFTPPGVGGALISQNQDFTGPGPNPNTATLGITINQMFAPFDVSIATAPFSPFVLVPPGFGQTEYLITVTFTNAIASMYPIGPIRIESVTSGVTLDSPNTFYPGPNMTPTPTNTAGAPQYQPAGHGSSVMWFGGLAGGGGQINHGNSATFTFSVDLPQTSGPAAFVLRFTANPEPGTLALAGIALGAGGWFVRRRRLAAVAANE